MTTIWKYPINARDHTWRRDMPKGAKVLTVQMQGEAAQMWALVNPDAPMVTRWFVTVGTGQTLPDDAWGWTYIGTIQITWIVFHVFEVPTP